MTPSKAYASILSLVGTLPFVFAQSSLTAKDLTAQLEPDWGVLRSCVPAANTSYDFSPNEDFQYRRDPGQYHTGDLTLRLRTGNSSSWIEGDTSLSRNLSLTTAGANASDVTSCLSPALGSTQDYVNVSRTWGVQDDELTLSFVLTNIHSADIEIGSLGMPIEMDNIFVNKTAAEVTQKCNLVDPYIGLDAGYVQVTRLTGTGPNLVLTPLGNATKLEAWRFLSEPQGQLGYKIQTYEGNYEWQVYTQAYAEQEWKGVDPWNSPTSKTLAAGESLEIGLRFSVASQVEDIEDTVASKGLPVAVGIPGYVLPLGLENRLFIQSQSNVSAMSVEPQGAIDFAQNQTTNGWLAYTVTACPVAFGRVRVTVTFDDGRDMAIHYYVADPGQSALSTLGNFLTTDQWYTNTSDPFHRAPSVISYDTSINDYVLQDNRTWIAGISDEGGAGSFVAAALKTSVQPVAAEVAKLEEMVQDTVFANLQINASNQTFEYTVRKGLFYYQPDLLPAYNYSSEWNWTNSWDYEAAYLINRAYDYVWVSSLYWSLYRAGRSYPDILTRQNASWYLHQSYHTVHAAFANNTDGTRRVNYNQLGLMGETFWGSLVSDLKYENYTSEANDIEDIMRSREAAWSGEVSPFGSEQAWDSTGEEGVYYWAHYFNDNSLQTKTINAIRGYMPTVPHWGWNGNARRYWDFETAGKISRIERQIHHYGSSLNALPLLEGFRSSPNTTDPASFYNLRVGFGGWQGSSTNIHQNGFGSMAFHSYPDTLMWDPYTGDYGPSFLGHTLGSGTYLVDHPTFGWLAFGGNILSQDGDQITVANKDTVQKAVFVAPLGLYVTVDAGTFQTFTYKMSENSLQLSISPLSYSISAPSAYMHLTPSAGNQKSFQVTGDGVSPAYMGYRVAFSGNCMSTVTITH